MTLFLGGIALFLFLGIVAASISSSRNDEVLGFITPEAVNKAEAEFVSTSLNIAPAATGHVPFEHELAKREAAASQNSSLGSFYPGNLGVGTTLTYRGVDSTIFGVVSFEFNGELWQDYLAEHGDSQWWRLGVQPDRGMELDAFEVRPVAAEPGPAALTVDGVIYNLTESGQAQYRSSGRTNLFETGRYAYFDYESAAGEVLNFERFDGGAWVTSIGHHVNPQAVQVTNTGQL